MSKVALTPQEYNIVVDMCIYGYTPQEIAKRRVLHISTIRTHLGHIYEKLGIENATPLKLSIWFRDNAHDVVITDRRKPLHKVVITDRRKPLHKRELIGDRLLETSSVIESIAIRMWKHSRYLKELAEEQSGGYKLSFPTSQACQPKR